MSSFTHSNLTQRAKRLTPVRSLLLLIISFSSGLASAETTYNVKTFSTNLTNNCDGGPPGTVKDITYSDSILSTPITGNCKNLANSFTINQYYLSPTNPLLSGATVMSTGGTAAIAPTVNCSTCVSSPPDMTCPVCSGDSTFYKVTNLLVGDRGLATPFFTGAVTFDPNPQFLTKSYDCTAFPSKNINFLYLQIPNANIASISSRYLAGTATFGPSVNTLTSKVDILGNITWSGSYSAPTGTCTGTTINNSTAGAFDATTQVSINTSGYFKNINSVAAFTPAMTVLPVSLGTNDVGGPATYNGITFRSNYANNTNTIFPFRAVAATNGMSFNLFKFTNVETDTAAAVKYATITVTAWNSPSAGLGKGTITTNPGGLVGNIMLMVAPPGGMGGAGGARIDFSGQDPDGTQYLLAGSFVARGPAGVLDTSFGTGGIKIDQISSATTNTNSVGHAAAIQSDGKLLVAGQSATGASLNEFSVTRYNTDGSNDNTFATSHKFQTQFSLPATAKAVTFTPNSTATVTGTVGTTTTAYINWANSPLLADEKVMFGGTPLTSTVTFTTTGSASTSFVNWTGHVLTANAPVIFTGTTMPSNITAGVTYYVKAPVANKFQVTTTSGGATAVIFSAAPAAVAVTATGSHAPAPLLDNTVYYVKSPTGTGASTKFLVSATPGGTGIALTTVGIAVTATQVGGRATATAHAYAANAAITFAQNVSSTLPAGLAVGTTYYVAASPAPLANSFFVSATNGGAAINLTAAGTGTFTVTGPGTSSTDSIAHGIALDTAGKIYATGYAKFGTTRRVVLVRLTSAGVLDATFGTGGVVLTDDSPGNNSRARGIKLDSTGKVVVAGDVVVGTITAFMVHRYTTAGVLDTTFNTTGKRTTQVDTSLVYGSSAQGLTIDASDNIYMVGLTYDPVSTLEQFALVKVSNVGALVTAFSTDGIVTVQPSSVWGKSWAYGIVLDGTKVTVVGDSMYDGTNFQFAAARFNATTGAVDTTFNGGVGGNLTGTVVFDASTFTTKSSTAHNISLRNNQYLVGGTGRIVTTGSNAFAMARLNSNGSLDSTFGTAGVSMKQISPWTTPMSYMGALDKNGAAITNNWGQIFFVGAAKDVTAGYYAIGITALVP